VRLVAHLSSQLLQTGTWVKLASLIASLYAAQEGSAKCMAFLATCDALLLLLLVVMLHVQLSFATNITTTWAPPRTVRRCPSLARATWRATRQWLQWDEQCMQRFALNPQDRQALQVWKRGCNVLEGVRAKA
jgi:hypothetical protein